MKRTRRVDAARSKAAPEAGSLAQIGSDRIVAAAQGAAAAAIPLAQQAYSKAGPLAAGAAAAAVPLAQQAYSKAGPLAVGAAAAAVPLAQQAYEKAGPLAHQAADAVAPYAQVVADRLSPFADRASDAVTPYAHRAAERLAPLVAGGAAVAHEAVDKVGPALEDAFDRAGTARDRVSDDLLPRLTTALSAAAASPLAVEAAKRGRATAAAARGELSLPEPPKGRWLKRVAVVAALAGVAVVVVRKLTGGSPDSGWQAARPSTPATPSTPPPSASATAPVVGTFGTAESDAPETDPQAGLNAHEESVLANGQAEPDQPAEGGDVTSPVTDEAPLGDEVAAEPVHEETGPEETTPEQGSSYGEGAYVGLEPPEGFVIKGNENSMKYHLPDGGGYEQTVAEVWFNSADAAEQAGFTRALG